MPKYLLLLILIMTVNGCAKHNEMNMHQQGQFAHIVFFWLKNPGNQEERKAFESSLVNFINQSEFIKTKHLGMPATTDRDVIVNSYNYCLSLTFDNKEMQDKYQEEPNHKKFIEESSKLWKKVIVYDSVNFLN